MYMKIEGMGGKVQNLTEKRVLDVFSVHLFLAGLRRGKDG